MPGVLIIEALAQAGGVLAYETATAEERIWILYLVGIEETRFKQTVRPGDQLMLRVELVKRRRNLWRFMRRRRGRRQASSPRRKFSWRTGPSLDRRARGRRSRRRRSTPSVYIGPYAVIGADVEIGARLAHRAARRHQRADGHRRRQPHLPVRVDRRRSAGQEIRGRADDGSSSATATRFASTARSIAARSRI